MRIPTVLALVAGTLFVAPPAVAEAATANGTGLIAFMSGGNEVPAGSGDADARGVALASIKPGSSRICYVIRVRNVDGTINGAHIHAGPMGKDGPVVAELTAPTNGAVAACTSIGKKLATAIRKNPRKYYVNVHSTAFPDGALRGQLRKA